jgi:hypothetical protein
MATTLRQLATLVYHAGQFHHRSAFNIVRPVERSVDLLARELID